MPRRVLFFGRAAAFLCLLLGCVTAGPSAAHRRAVGQDNFGISIPALTHGQMAVIAAYRRDILALAAQRDRTDETFRTLLNFGNIQSTYCLWGLVPASLSDEASPFNECSHAYLSATQALLVHMRNDPDLPSQTMAVEALISRIDGDMVRNGASFVLCRFSGEDFNTATLIHANWSAVPFHGPTLATFGAMGVALIAGIAALFKGRRYPPHTKA